MNGISGVYNKFRNFIENILFPALLILYPLSTIRQGIDVADTTYSLANFQYFVSMDGTWMVATFLANVVGNFMMHLPLGDTLLGMYFYTTLIEAVTALGTYAVLRKKIPAPLVFMGEWIALGLCWCPSAVLYNYLTYLFMAAGILLLYDGIIKDDRKLYVAAGICLGINVTVRMPNVVQTAFIAALWYGAVIYNRTFRKTLQDTLCCILGYVIGFGVPFAVICIRYGVSAYPTMVQTMFAMTDKATDYKPTAMLTGMFTDYKVGLFWLIFAGICIAGGCLLLTVQHRLLADSRIAALLCRIVYIAVLLVLIRFYWGRGVFTLLYYENRSMYYPAVLLLLAAIFAALYCLISKGFRPEQKILAVLVPIQIFVTPLGSNNFLYPIINNLFIVVPFILWIIYDRCGCGRTERTQAVRAEKSQFGAGRLTFILMAPLIMLIALVFIQSTGFHMSFAFQDGIYGEPRDTTLTVPSKAAGIYTNQDNAARLEELAGYVESANLTGREVILYGEIPGLGYLLDMPSALSTFWPDLPSYTMAEYERDMAQITTPPVIIISSPIAAYLSEDADGMDWLGTDRESLEEDEKLQILSSYMTEHSYYEVFGNGRYVVYVTE